MLCCSDVMVSVRDDLDRWAIDQMRCATRGLCSLRWCVIIVLATLCCQGVAAVAGAADLGVLGYQARLGGRGVWVTTDGVIPCASACPWCLQFSSVQFSDYSPKPALPSTQDVFSNLEPCLSGRSLPVPTPAIAVRQPHQQLHWSSGCSAASTSSVASASASQKCLGAEDVWRGPWAGARSLRHSLGLPGRSRAGTGIRPSGARA